MQNHITHIQNLICEEILKTKQYIFMFKKGKGRYSNNDETDRVCFNQVDVI